ncbi:enoyl-CoA hydratase [Pedobacter sp. UYEF25]
MEYQNLLITLKDHILHIVINREKALNALNQLTLEELALVVKHVEENDEILGVIVTGAGEKAFVAGADIKEFANFDLEGGKQLAINGQNEVFNAIENASKVYIAAINGFALGGGLELAMACHIRIASENAKLGLPEVTLGLIPGYGGTQRLTQLVGKGKAIEMITTANIISAAEGERIGLLNYVVSQEELINKAEELFGAITQRAPLAVAAALKSVQAGANLSLNFEAEIEGFAGCFNTADFKEGVSAFLEKRKPKFTKK